jgi:hypothetical protein
MYRKLFLTLIPLFIATIFAPAQARADKSAALVEARPRAYAILVGNNAGGPGQSDLRFAEEDAARILEVLSELGGYDLQPSSLLLSPSPTELWNRFESVQLQLERDRGAGVESLLFFYYSGHARSSAIDLGPQQVALVDLRKRIESMPAALRIVILDACQSGAISRVKGASPAVDFSTNSVAGLTMRGLAIMASSTGAELSQESDSLQGSYFTHHLVAGLRGVADKNEDGSVSLSEAYEYAYANTLLATALSAVGKQHVTLETDLQGKGDVALTRPASADAKLRLPKDMQGELTIAHSKSKSVLAEIQKVSGKATTIAFPPALYTVLLREGKHHARSCKLRLRSGGVTTLNPAECSVVAITSGSDKGGPGDSPAVAMGGTVRDTRAPWNLDLSVGLRSRSKDAYTDRLETFGYEQSVGFADVHSQYSIRAIRRVGPRLSLGASMGSLESDAYRRRTDGASTYNLRWSAHHLSALARIDQSWGANQFFAETELGFSRASSTLSETEMSRSTSEVHYGYSASAALGLALMPWTNFGFTLRLGYGLASTLSNELGETHIASGVLTSLGVRVAL